MAMHAQRILLHGSPAVLLALLAACSGGGGGAGTIGGGGFELTSLNLNNGAVWQINRRIEFTFNDEVDFSSVSLNTISIRTPAGKPATGAS